MIQLSEYQLRGEAIPPTIYYVPDFISAIEEAKLIEYVQREPRTRWVQLNNRSLQQYGGVPRPNGMIAEPMPMWLKIWTDQLSKMDIFDGKEANHVLMNRYEPGQGIMPHGDGPMYYPVVSTINTGGHTVLNFYRKNPAIDGDCKKISEIREYAFSLYLQPRSLLVLKDDVYNEYEHGIEEITNDRLQPVNTHLHNQVVVINLNEPGHLNSPLTLAKGQQVIEVERTKTRYSFTIRHVPNVIHSRLTSWLFKAGNK